MDKNQNQKQNRQAKRAALEADFIQGLEIIFGFPLLDRHKKLVLDIRRQNFNGHSLDLEKLRIQAKG